MNFDSSGSDEVRRFVCDNAIMWLRDFHFDGLRIDSVHEMVGTSAVHVLEQMVREVRDLEIRLRRKVLLIAEDGTNNPQYVRPLAEGGLGFDAQWSSDFALSLSAAITSERQGMLGDYDSKDVIAAVKTPFVYRRHHSNHRGHAFGRPTDDVIPQQFVVYDQNHDLVGNRKEGDRLGRRVDVDRLKVASAITLLSQYTPMLFQGQEWNASTPFLYFADCQETKN